MSTVITPPTPSVPPTSQITQADQADPPEVPSMQLSSIEQAESLGLPIPCRAFDPEVFFAETPADVEYAKSLCGTCPVKEACLAGALERREPWGVWGGELFVQGVVVARKRPRGRPRKTEVMA
ncbi:WhiB family transcriptional regulator [Kitasatospora sp. NPDC127116]